VTDAPPVSLTTEPPARADVPYYRPSGTEVELCRAALECGRPVMLVGPTGCGKTRFVEHITATLGRPLRTIVGNDDTTTADLLGRFLVTGGDVRWVDGPLTLAARRGEICYIDEVVEVRREALAALYPLADDRRCVFLDRVAEVVAAAPGFGLMCSYNPGRSLGFKDLRSAFRQRFVTIALDYLDEVGELEVLRRESGVDQDVARRLVAVATALRQGLSAEGPEAPSTRSLVVAAELVSRGIAEDVAVQHCVVAPLVHGSDVPPAAVTEIVSSLY